MSARKLASIFKTAALAAAVLLTGGCLRKTDAAPKELPANVIQDEAHSTSAPLTQDEKVLLHGIFGDEIDTAVITKYFYPRSPLMVSRVPTPQAIMFYGDTCYSTDYANDADIFKFGTFVHEATHIWQRQNIPEDKLDMCQASYGYSLNKISRFDDFCVEKQAAIMEDYARRFLHRGHKSFYAKDTPGHDKLLQKVVEDRFPGVRDLRLNFASREKARKDFTPPTRDWNWLSQNAKFL